MICQAHAATGSLQPTYYADCVEKYASFPLLLVY